MSVRLAQKIHHSIKNLPGLKWADAIGLIIWIKILSPILRAACAVELFVKLAGIALWRRKRLVAVYRFGGIGDIICSFPTVREFVRRNPQLQIVYVTLSSNRSLIARSNVDIPCVSVAMHVTLYPSISCIFGQGIYLSYGDEEESLNPPPTPLIDALGEKLGINHAIEDPVLRTDPAQIALIREAFLKKNKRILILLHTGPTWRVRGWQHEFWIDLTTQLSKNPDFQILKLVAQRNLRTKEAYSADIPGALPIECFGKVERLIDTIGAADLLIGLDSGPLHVAAAVGTPCVALFGPTDPALRLVKSNRSIGLFHQLPCSFCHHRRPRLHWESGCPFDIACMKEIPVELVLKAALSLLSAQASPSG